jgi:hypothetical protein
MRAAAVRLAVGGFAALLGSSFLLGGCGSGKDSNSDALDVAAFCGNIHFQSPPRVVFTERSGNPPPNGDTSIRLVVDVPNTDIGYFEKLSDLPEPTPGPPEVWASSYLKDKALSDEIKAGGPADFQHVLQDRNGTPYSRLVVIQKTQRPDTRIYISASCG